MVSFSRQPSRKGALRQLRRRQTLALEELDQRLDVEVARFDRTVKKLVGEMRTKEVRVELPPSRLGAGPAPVGAGVSWVRLFDAQVKRLARTGRAEEFTMARRYAFIKARVASALTELGFAEDRHAEIMRAGSDKLPRPPRRARRAAVNHARVTLAELEALRNDYVEGSLYMVVTPAYRYRNLGVDLVDLIQEGCASLFQAIDGFDWKRDVRFKTYAQYWIHQAILKVLYNSSRTVRVPIWVQKTLAKIQRVREQGRLTTGQAPSADAVGEELGLSGQRVRDLLQTKRFATSLDAEVGDEEGVALGALLPDDRLAPVEELIDDGNLAECLDEVMSELPVREQVILARRFGLHGREPETLGTIAEDLGITAERVRQIQKVALSKLQRPALAQRLRAFTV